MTRTNLKIREDINKTKERITRQQEQIKLCASVIERNSREIENRRQKIEESEKALERLFTELELHPDNRFSWELAGENQYRFKTRILSNRANKTEPRTILIIQLSDSTQATAVLALLSAYAKIAEGAEQAEDKPKCWCSCGQSSTMHKCPHAEKAGYGITCTCCDTCIDQCVSDDEQEQRGSK